MSQIESEELSLSRFRELVAAYGANFERWPATLQEPARALYARAPEARALCEQHAPLDAWLSLDTSEALPAGLEQRLLSVPQQRRKVLPFKPRSLIVPALGWAAAAAFGLWLGASDIADQVAPADDVSAQAAQTADDEAADDDEQLLALTTGSFEDDWLETP